MTIKEWQDSIREWARSKGFNWEKWDIDTMLLRLHSEVSEASEAVRDKNYIQLGEELADVFIRLADTSSVMEINLEEEVIKKMEKNNGRLFLHGRPTK